MTNVRNLVIMPVLLGQEMTRRAIASVERQSIAHGATLMAIDNGSQDGCGPYLRSIRDGIILQSYTAPKSLHAVWNAALRFAFDQLHLPYALVINNDVVLRHDTMRLLAEDGGPFVTGVSVDKPEDTYTTDPSARSPHPCFSCFLIRKEVWDAVGEFDEGLWAYCGDASYHLKMERAGIFAYSIGIPFLHIGSGTIKNADPAQRDYLLKLAEADRSLFERKHGFKVGSDEYYAQFSRTQGKPYQERGRLD